MKISTSLFNKQQVESFSKLNEEIQSLQNRISSGKNIVQASDDPIGAVELSGLQQVKERFNQYSRNADNAINRLTIADNALQSITNLMARAKELAIQAANDTFGAQDREALALAMRREVKLLTNDKKMNEHFDKYSKEDRKIAEEWLDNNRIGYFFSENNMILMDCIPRCLKKGATA